MLRRQPDFVKLWIGQAISQMGSRVTREGLPMTAVLVLGATPLQMGLLNGAGAVGVLTFGLFAGAWADRLRRRPILIGTDIGRALLLGSIPAAALLHRLTMSHLYAVAAIAGLLTVLFDVSYQAYVPLLSEGDLLDLNSKLTLSETVAEVAGPGVTGLLVQWLTAPIAIAVDAASYVVSAVSLALIRIREPQPERHATPDILREIGEGLGTAWRHPLLRALLARVGTLAFFGGIMGSLYVLFAIRVLGLSPALLGGIIAIGGIAATCGAFITQPLTRRFGIGPTMIGCAVLTGFASLLTPMAHGSTLVAASFLAASQVNDIGWTVYSINEVSLRQSVVPSRLLGRVNSATQLLFRGLIPVGALFGGALAQAIGVRQAMFLGGCGILLSSAWLIFSPLRSLRFCPKD